MDTIEQVTTNADGSVTILTADLALLTISRAEAFRLARVILSTNPSPPVENTVIVARRVYIDP